jgi:hypothetical protein
VERCPGKSTGFSRSPENENAFEQDLEGKTMNDVDPEIDRLLRSAASSQQEIEMPFGFDTRVVALARSGVNDTELVGLARLLRYVAVVAAIILITTAAGIYREDSRNRENSEPFANEFAIADSEIQSEFSP